jgi:hypothetical protein
MGLAPIFLLAFVPGAGPPKLSPGLLAGAELRHLPRPGKRPEHPDFSGLDEFGRGEIRDRPGRKRVRFGTLYGRISHGCLVGFPHPKPP